MLGKPVDHGLIQGRGGSRNTPGRFMLRKEEIAPVSLARLSSKTDSQTLCPFSRTGWLLLLNCFVVGASFVYTT